VRWADFAGPYTGAMILRGGHAGKLYHVSEQVRVQENLPGQPGMFLPYLYPPFQAVLLLPLTRLGYRSAYIGWGVINILLWLVARRLLTNAIALDPYRCLKLCSLFFPVAVTIIQGQFSLIVLVSFVLTYSLLQQKREFAAGVALGAGLVKFQIVLPFALIFVFRRKWKFIAGLTTVAGFLVAVSLLAVGLSGLLSYAHLLADIARHPSAPMYSTLSPANMPTVRGFLLGLFSRRIPLGWVAILWLAVSGGLLILVARYWDSREGDRGPGGLDLVFAAALAASVAVAPHLNVHDLTPMLLAIILVIASPEWAVKSNGRLVLLSTISILYVMPLYYLVLVGFGALYLVAPVLIVFALATLGLAGKTTVCKSEGTLSRPDSRSTHPVGVTR
jgi:Glycosyltransferase family 87